MTKKDYELIVKVIRTANPRFRERRALTDVFAKALKADNPRFDADRFTAAIMEGNPDA